jgi:hypothetical protein
MTPRRFKVDFLYARNRRQPLHFVSLPHGSQALCLSTDVTIRHFQEQNERFCEDRASYLRASTHESVEVSAGFQHRQVSGESSLIGRHLSK